MQSRLINPWKRQDDLGFSQAVELSGYDRIVVCPGQTSMSAGGQPLHAGDMKAQIVLALDNIETVLRGAGMTLTNIRSGSGNLNRGISGDRCLIEGMIVLSETGARDEQTTPP